MNTQGIRERIKLVTWNTQMAFHTKVGAFNRLGADIAVLCEVAHPDVLDAKMPKGVQAGLNYPTSLEWVGTNHNKGLLVATWNGIEVHPLEQPTQQWVVPYQVSGGGKLTTLVAVWENQKMVPGPVGAYVGLRNWLASHGDMVTRAGTVIAGDYNYNPSIGVCGWLDRKMGHLSQTLIDAQLYSAWHTDRGEWAGEESVGTIFFNRKKDQPYHIDYIHTNLEVSDTAVGNYDDWGALSDHMPVSALLHSLGR